MDLSKLNKEQLEAVQTTDGPLMVLAGAGSGKALANGTCVLTRNGYLPIEKLKVGSRIYGSDGNLHKVLGVYPQGKKDVFTVLFVDGTVIKCCKDHLWNVFIDNELKTVNTKFLSKLPNIQNVNVPTPHPIQFSEQPIPFNEYIVGVFLGAGKITEKGVRFLLKNNELKTNLENLLKNEGYKLIQVKEFLYKTKPLDDNKSLEEIFAELNLSNKRIPKVYKFNAVHIRRNLLKGFIDAIGVNQGNFYECIIDEDIKQDLNFVAQHLGFLTKNTKQNILVRKAGVVANKEINKIKIFPSYKHINKLHTLSSKDNDSNSVALKKSILKISKTPAKVDMTCIKIDAKDELFVIDNATLTHNTTVLVNKVAYLIEKGVSPSRILMLTFTNKAADEMMVRIKALLGKDDEDLDVQGGTYHSFCAEILRRNAEEIGFESDFSICDVPDSAEIINLIKERLGFKKEDNLPSGKIIFSLFSYCINQGKDIEYAIRNRFTQCEGKQEELEKIRESYIIYKYNNNILDYDDLLIQTNNLFESNPEIVKKLSSFYQYILVDEYQDSNKLQMELLLKLRSFDNKNLCVVGDPEQCVVAGTKIRTNNGIKNIEDVSFSDKFCTSTGRFTTSYFSASKIKKIRYNGPICKIQTKSGKILKTTPEHIFFVNPIVEDRYYIYVLFNRTSGYKIGTYNAKTKQKQASYRVVCDKKYGEKLWVIDSFASKNDLFINFEKIKKYFKLEEDSNNCYNISKEDVKQLFKEKILYFEYPTYMKTNHDGSVFKISHTLFGDTFMAQKRNFYKSLFVVDSLNYEATNEVSKMVNVPICNRHQKGQLDRFIVKKICVPGEMDYKIKKIVESPFFKENNGVIDEGVFLTDIRFSFLPASHVKEGMKVVVYEENLVKEEEIIEYSFEHYEGFVFDINISGTHNFFANDICVHNCIYGFRGSRYDNILEFPNQFKDCKIIKLNQNYRSNQEILDLSNSFMSGKGVFENKLVGQYKCGFKPKLIMVPTQQDEAMWVVRKIDQYIRQGVSPSSIAVLARTSNASSAVETRLIGIDYNKYGGIRFWERESTKNVLSILKVVNNIKDEISWFRILKLFPLIGSVNAKKITEGLLVNGIDELKESKYTKKQYFEYLEEIFKEYDYIKNLDLIEKIRYVIDDYYLKIMRRNINCRKIKDTDKIKMLNDLDEDIERLQNLIELAKGYRSLNSYINDLLLDSSSNTDKNNAITISTIHSAKGLEWDIVFLLDCIDGSFPSDKGLSAFTDEAIKAHNEELEEEKRIFYVAVTRCKKDLYLMYPQYNIHTKRENDLSEYLVENEVYKTKCEQMRYL